MKLIIKKITKKDISEAESFFGNIFCDDLKKEKAGTYNESLVARYLIKKNKNNFSSISHKKNLVFVGISENKIGVDIEIYKKRDENILNKFSDLEYEKILVYNFKSVKTLCLQEKKWNTFYILWTAKESIIKYENLTLDNMQNIVLEKASKIEKTISEINFDLKFEFSFKNKKLKVFSGNNKEIFYSICV